MFANFYWKWERVVPDNICDEILANAQWDGSIDGVIVKPGGTEVNTTTRKTKVLWLPNSSIIGCVAHAYIHTANKVANWNFAAEGIEDVQIGKYEDGGHYEWHMDSGAPNVYGHQRKLSVSIMLNDPSEYEGGELEFRHMDPLKLPKGSIVVFPSMVEHRVLPVTSGVRYSAVTWAHGPAFK